MYNIDTSKIDISDISELRTRQYFEFLIKFCTNRCQWECPNGIPYFYPEYLLSFFGHFGIFERDGEIIFATGSFSGKILRNGIFEKYIGITPNGETYEGKINEDCVVIGNNSLFRPDKLLVARFAHLLNEIDKSLDVNLVNTRLTKGFVADNDKDKMALDSAYTDVKKGKLFVAVAPTHRPMHDILDSTTDGVYTPFDFTNSSDSDKLQYLSRLYDDIIGRFLSMYGIDTGNVNKGSQILQKEISRLAEASAVQIDDCFKMREYGIDCYNKVFGRNDLKFTKNPLYACDTAINPSTEGEEEVKNNGQIE